MKPTPKQQYDAEMERIRASQAKVLAEQERAETESVEEVDNVRQLNHLTTPDKLEDALWRLVEKSSRGQLNDQFVEFLVQRIAEVEDDLCDMKEKLLQLVETNPDLLR